MSSTAALATFAATLRADRLPNPVAERVKLLLLDALACAVAGHEGGQVGEVRRLVATLGSGTDATVIAGGRSTPAGATLLNGYLITAVNACDIYRPAFAHLTPSVVPPAFVVAEAEHRSGADLVAALAAGLEVAARIGRAIGYPAFRARGWQSSGVIGPFGGAAAVGRLLNLDPDQMVNAFGLAGSQAAGTSADWGTPGNKFHQFRAALSGLLAGRLAAEGYLAGSDALEAPDGGLFSTYTDGAEPGLAGEGLGDHWELLEIGQRRWPTASALQGMVTAIAEVADGTPREANTIERVEIGVAPDVHVMHGGLPDPQGKFQALQSAHYVAAAYLVDGRLWLDQFDDARAADTRLRELMRDRVVVTADPTLAGVAATVVLRMRDGSVADLHADVALGDPRRPLERAQIEEKLRQAASERLDERVVEEVVATVATLETIDDVAPLLAALAGAVPATTHEEDA